MFGSRLVFLGSADRMANGFYIIIAGKVFSPFFFFGGGGHMPPSPTPIG